SAPAPTPAAPAPSPAPAAAPPSASASSTTTTPTTSTTTTGTPTAPTTAVVTIATTDTLENIKSISSPKGSAGGNGAGSNEEVTKLSLTSENATFQVGTTGAKVNINKEGIALMPQGANNTGGANGANPFADTASITIKAGAKPVNKDSLESFEKGQEPSITFSTKETDGKKIGSGKITGLKDLENGADGTSAVNKNYVDEQVKNLNNNRPFDFYLGNEKVVKGADGSFKKLKDGTLQDISEEEKKQVVIKAEPSTAPIGISNVASGLGLEAQTEEEKKKTQEKSAELTKAVEEKVKAVSKEAKALSDKAQTFTDLALAVSSLEQAINALPEGNDKTQAEAKLKENQMKLDEAKKALEQARNDLKEAQTGLTKAEEAYEQNYKGYEKVVELVKPDSSAELTNVATIGDLQAVAKSGLKFKGNDDMEIRTALSGTLAIKGEEGANGNKFNSDRTAAGNIKVEMSQDGKGLEVKLSDQLKNMTSFETREINGKKSRLDSNGLNVENTSTKERSQLNENRLAFYENDKLGLNLDGKSRALRLGEKSVISINAKGEALVSDLNTSSSGMAIANKNYVDTKDNELRTQLNTTDRNLRAGIAGALAAAGLPMSSVPGKSMFAASAGTFKGQNALALGYSRVSDNGKITLRLQGTRSSTGDVGGSVGVGYQW
ncbi:YadA C-terminal domain-containing protein, partial [Histophilus somni]